MSEALIQRFAPSLFLHPLERFIPSDAKRYMEHANVWVTGAPFDDKTRWGGSPTSPFPRSPAVAAGGLSGVVGEPGTMIDVASLSPPGTDTHLEFGGWLDANGVSEPGVTATSGNVFPDRNAIANRYASEQKLRDSQYWYHGEVIEGARLTTLVKNASATNLDRYVTPTSALICYYFFFPAHKGPVGADCGLAGQENGSHAADWQCMAILAEGDGTGDAAAYVPKFFGCTGARHIPADSGPFRPYDFDDDGYTVMKVERWRPSSGPAKDLPELDGDHPRLYVSLDTHSLYTTPGPHEVWPFRDGESSAFCGTFDTHSVMPKGWGQPEPENPLRDMGAFFAKVLGGSGVGVGALGLPLGPAIGAVAGLASAAAENALPRSYGLSLVGTADNPPPDQTPANPGEANVIRPASVAVAGAGPSSTEWRITTTTIDGRAYTYVVDRETQRIWPHDDNERGYRGRWGQMVTKDFLPRRAGPRFPNYVKMFFAARAFGDTNGAYLDE